MNIYQKAIDKFGKENQIIKAMEELSELTKELAKNLQGADNIEHIAEEMADVDIMLDQIIEIFHFEDLLIEKRIEKIERLEGLVK